MSPRPLDPYTAKASVKLLIFVVVTSLATAALALTIGNVGLGEALRYKAVFSDATGVEKGDDVRISGVRVGEVKDLAVKNSKYAEVTFTVESEVPVGISTNAAIRFRNLVGQRYIALTQGTGPADPLPEGGTIPLSQTAPALDLTVLFNGFKPLFAALSPQEVNQLSYEIIQVLQGEAGTVEDLLAHTASLTTTLANRDKVIGDLIDNLNAVVETLAVRDERLNELIIELQRFISGLSGDRKAIGNSLEAIVSLNKETAGLVGETRPDLKTDIAELHKVAGTLDDNSEIVEKTLRNMPGKLDTITRTATYGSWFNFYLCDFDGRVVLPTGQELARPTIHTDVARCSR